MRATFNRTELLALAKAADSIAPPSSPLDILQVVLLEAGEDGIVTLSATNLEVTLEQRLRSDVEEPGCLCINARLFAEMLRLLGGETVTILGQDGKQVQLTSESASYVIPVLSSKDCPRMEIPFPEDTVPVTGLPAMAKRTVFAASEDENKPLMRCVNLIFDSDGLHGVSSDGTRLATARGDSSSKASVSMLIPAHSLEKLARLVGSKDTLYVGATGKTVVFTKENFSYSARLMEGQYIDARRVLNSFRSSFTVLTDAAALWETVSSVTSVAGSSTGFSITFLGDRLRVHCESADASSAREMSVVPLSGDPSGEYWYSYRQLSECLRALTGTLMLEVGQNGILVMRTDELVCLQNAMRKPVILPQQKKEKKEPKEKKEKKKKTDDAAPEQKAA